MGRPTRLGSAPGRPHDFAGRQWEYTTATREERWPWTQL
jgi:hypothetical protein